MFDPSLSVSNTVQIILLLSTYTDMSSTSNHSTGRRAIAARIAVPASISIVETPQTPASGIITSCSQITGPAALDSSGAQSSGFQSNGCLPNSSLAYRLDKDEIYKVCFIIIVFMNI